MTHDLCTVAGRARLPRTRRRFTASEAFSRVFFIIVIAFFVSPSLSAADPWPGDSGTLIWNYGEPSGIVWHVRLGKLFWVHDNGYLYRVDSDGTFNWSYTVGGDLEGIAIADHSTDNIYVATERTQIVIKERSVTTGASTTKQWRLTEMEGDGNAGLESLTFVPNGAHPYDDASSGGLFYAGKELDGNIYVYDVDLDISESVTHIDTITLVPGRTALCGMHFDRETGVLYALFRNNALLREVEPDGTFIAEYSVPGSSREGVTVVPSCPSTDAEVYIAQDNGPIYKYGSYPVTCADSDADGLTNSEEWLTYGTEPYAADGDGDGMSDYDEVWYDDNGGYDPGVTDTDANDVDTDGDGYSDCFEVTGGGDPLDDGARPSRASISFQPASSAVPAGFCPDSGSVDASRGYGW